MTGIEPATAYHMNRGIRNAGASWVCCLGEGARWGYRIVTCGSQRLGPTGGKLVGP